MSMDTRSVENFEYGLNTHSFTTNNIYIHDITLVKASYQ